MSYILDWLKNTCNQSDLKYILYFKFCIDIQIFKINLIIKTHYIFISIIINCLFIIKISVIIIKTIYKNFITSKIK